jgi:hypothetical protein
MKSKLFAVLFLAGSSLFAGPRFGFGFGFGYAPAPVPVYAAPPAPLVAYAPPVVRPGYTWVGGYWYPAGPRWAWRGGYWYPAGPRWAWRGGYWARPPYARSYWVAPRYFGGRYYRGYWRR